MRILIILIVLGLAALLAFVRLAPVQSDRFHTAGAPRDPGDYPETGRFTAVRTLAVAPDKALAAIEQAAQGTDRTRRIAGSVADGMLTFETRSRVIGFPDYTTVSIIAPGAAPGGNDTPLLMIHARLRFGLDDLGVNQRRVVDWLAKLEGLVTAP